VADLGGPRLSWRRLDVLLRHLPIESSYVRATGGDDVAWTISEHLLAIAADALQIGNWQRQGDKNKPRPKPIPRPGHHATGSRRTTLTPRQIYARLRDLQRRADARRR
jgi:hypothetical protein